MSLRSIQEQIFTIVRSDKIPVNDLVVSQGSLSQEERLRTYQRSSYLKPHSCLSEDFQGTKSILEDLKGPDFFDELASEYFKAHPADSHYINECGKAFPNFVAQRKIVEDLPFLKDLLRLEWLRIESFYDFFDHKAPSDQSSSLRKNTSIKQFESQWPLDQIWEKKKAFPNKKTHVFVWTTEDRSVHVRSWGAEESKILAAIIGSPSLDHAVETLLEHFDSTALTDLMTKNLSKWVNSGLIELRT